MNKIIMLLIFLMGTLCGSATEEHPQGYACPFHYTVEETPCEKYYDYPQETRDELEQILIHHRNPALERGIPIALAVLAFFGFAIYKIASISVSEAEKIAGRKLTPGEKAAVATASVAVVGGVAKLVANAVSKPPHR